MNHDVLITYSPRDNPIAHKVLHALEQNGIICWIAPRDISSSANYADEISEAVKSARIVVLVGSQYSFDSRFVMNEISLAFENSIPILPFMVDVDLPRDKMEFYLKKVHWISAYPNPEQYLEELVKSAFKLLDEDVSDSDVEDEFDVFISYSSHDNFIAYEACHVLEKSGYKCWIAPRNIIAGQDFPIQISEAIKNSGIVVLIASKHAYESVYLELEMDIVLRNNKSLLSFHVDSSIPEGKLTYYLRHAKWLECYPRPEMHLDDLVSGVGLLLGECESQDFEVEIRNYWEIDNGPEKEKSHDEEVITLKRPFDAYSGDEPYIFVSYAHKDSDLVFKEIRKFHDAGYHVWYDQGLTAGQEWDEEIEDALMDCSLLVVFISENSMASNNVVDEIKLALEEKIDIVPIYLEDAKLARGLKLRLSQKHSIFKYNSSEEEYLNACFKAFDSAGIPKAR